MATDTRRIPESLLRLREETQADLREHPPTPYAPVDPAPDVRDWMVAMIESGELRRALNEIGRNDPDLATQ